MTSVDLLDEAVAELYSADPDEFTQRRQEFTGRARAAGQAAVARQIAALRKPTRSAWVVNRLARSDPDAVGQLDDLGRDLRAAERARDGRAMRELAQRRRQLIAALVRQALAASGQAAAPAGMREELTGTFAAAIADPEVAAQIQQGTLVRAVQRAAFGSDQPTLAVVPSPPDGKQGSRTKAARAKTAKAKPGAAKPKPGPDEAEPDAAAPDAAAPDETAPDETAPDETAPDETAPDKTEPGSTRAGRPAAAEQRRAEARAAEEQRRAQAREAQERRRAEVRAKAERAVADADQAVAAAESDQLEQQMAIRRLERELTEARRKLRAAGAEARRAEAAQRRAHQALDRLHH